MSGPRSDREIRADLKARYPACTHCRKPCVAGQVDALDRPAHYLCCLALWGHRRFRHKAHLLPGLPRYEMPRPTQTSSGNRLVEQPRGTT